MDNVISKTVIELAKFRCDIFLIWISSHCGIVGNERADELAKAGAVALAPNPICLPMEQCDYIFIHKAYEIKLANRNFILSSSIHSIHKICNFEFHSGK